MSCPTKQSCQSGSTHLEVNVDLRAKSDACSQLEQKLTQARKVRIEASSRSFSADAVFQKIQSCANPAGAITYMKEQTTGYFEFNFLSLSESCFQARMGTVANLRQFLTAHFEYQEKHNDRASAESLQADWAAGFDKQAQVLQSSQLDAKGIMAMCAASYQTLSLRLQSVAPAGLSVCGWGLPELLTQFRKVHKECQESFRMIVETRASRALKFDAELLSILEIRADAALHKEEHKASSSQSSARTGGSLRLERAEQCLGTFGSIFGFDEKSSTGLDAIRQ